MEDIIGSGDPNDKSATGDASQTATPAGQGGSEAGAGASQDGAGDRTDDTEDIDELREHAEILKALHDPARIKEVWPIFSKMAEESGIDLKELVGAKAANAIEAKVEAAGLDLDASDMEFEGGLFKGTEEEMAKKLVSKFSAVVKGLRAELDALKGDKTQFESFVKKLTPVAEREAFRAEQRQTINLHGSSAKAVLLKDYGIQATTPDLEAAFGKNPESARTKQGLVNAVVALKSRKNEGTNGPELVGAGVGVERAQPSGDIEAMISNVVSNARKGR